MAERPGVRTLLIVDDHAGFRSFARALLEAHGYVVVGEAGDGASAVEAARRLSPEVVLLDIALPDDDGFAVCERIVTGSDCASPDPSRRPAVVLTSSRDVAPFRRRLSESCAVGFLAKRDLTGAALAALVDGRPLA
ncbi:MAG: response regulator transcription factor [Actinobacteria bacterium]|nr:response regulator transcription factor [Actinomycetota bacterium]